MMNFEQTAKAIVGDFVVEEKGVESLTTAQLKPLLQWKLHGVSGKGRKFDLIRQWNELPSPPAAQPWTDEEESSLERIRSATISLQDTSLADERKRIATSFSVQVQHLLLALSRSWSRQWQALRPDRLVLQTWTLMMANV
jgi:hypothetical protein